MEESSRHRHWLRWFQLLVGATVLFGIIVRLYRLGYPQAPVFDEVYFPTFAWKLLHGALAFDVHPPLGKMIIASALAIFGNTPFAWRIWPALFGIGLVLLMGGIWWMYAQDRAGSLFLMAAIAVEPSFVVYSRTGLMDGILLFCILAAFCMAVRTTRPRDIFWPSTWMGLAMAIKWIGLGVSVPIAYLMWRKGYLRQYFVSLAWSIGLYISIVLLGEVMGRVAHPWTAMIEWHRQAFLYHLNLNATHPWGSHWWGWPLMLRPVLFWYNQDATGYIHVMTNLGNFFLWWSSTIAVIAAVVVIGLRLARRQPVLDHPLVPLLLGYASFWLPWSKIHRVLFLYHYLPAYAFALLILAYWVGKWWKHRPALVVGYTAVVILVGVLYLPLATAWPLSQKALDAHFWYRPLVDRVPGAQAWMDTHPDFKGWL